ncbi:MAG TPA: NDP-sugar synthase [Thermoplasmata archaeon]|nr:NDP-sugar synthase [Thermoplasmata archaeon]
MKALVLIGGFGTRLRPVTYEVPKQLIPIAGKPLLYHVLDLLPEEVDGAVFATGYKAEVIERHVREHPLRFPVQTVAEAEPLGTGGGMKNAGAGMSDPFVLLNSDVVSEVDVTALLAAHRRRSAFGTMYLAHVDDTRPYGVAALGEGDRIERFVEKPEPADSPSHWINAGIAVWDRAVLDEIPPGRAVSFEREIVPGLLGRGVYGFLDRGFWEDAGSPERLLRAQRLLFDAGRAPPSEAPSGAPRVRHVAFGRNDDVAGATIGPYVTLGDHVTVASGAHVEDAVVMDGAVIGKGARLRASLIGPGTRVEPGQDVHDAVLARRSGP